MEVPGQGPRKLAPDLDVKDLSFVTDSGIVLLDNLSFSLEKGEQLALIGFSGSGKSTLALCVAQLYKYTSGSAKLGGMEVAELTKTDMVENMGFVSQSPFIFSGTIKDNLLYSCAARKEIEDEDRGRDLPNLDDMIGVLQQDGSFRGRSPVRTQRGRRPRGVRTRGGEDHPHPKRLSGEFRGKSSPTMWSSSTKTNTSIFPAWRKTSFSARPTRSPSKRRTSATYPYFMEFLDNADLTRPAVGTGLGTQSPDRGHFGAIFRPKPFSSNKAPSALTSWKTFKVLVERLKQIRLHQLSSEDRRKLLELALRFTPGRHKMASLPQMLEQLILEGRALFREKIEEHDPEAFVFLDTSAYIHSQTLLNNILFGRTKSSNPGRRRRSTRASSIF